MNHPLQAGVRAASPRSWRSQRAGSLAPLLKGRMLGELWSGRLALRPSVPAVIAQMADSRASRPGGSS